MIQKWYKKMIHKMVQKMTQEMIHVRWLKILTNDRNRNLSYLRDRIVEQLRFLRSKNVNVTYNFHIWIRIRFWDYFIYCFSKMIEQVSTSSKYRLTVFCLVSGICQAFFSLVSLPYPIRGKKRRKSREHV